MELFKLVGTIAIDNATANKEIDNTTNKAQTSQSEISDAFAKIGTGTATIAKGIGLAGTAIAGAWVAAIEGTREYRVSMGKLETAFATSGHSAATAKDTYNELNSVLGDSAVSVEAANHLAKLTDNEKDLQTWTNICTGVFATFGDSLPIEGLTEAANETAKTGVLTGGLTDALNWAGESEEAFQESLDACTSEQERQSLITNTLNGLYSEAATKYKETNKEVIESEKAQGRLTDAMAEIGAIGEPIMTAIKNAIADMVTVVVPKIQSLVDKFKDAKTWIKDNEDTVHKWIAAILGAVTAIGTFILIISWNTIMTKAANALKVVRTAMLALNAAMRANPIGIVISIIAGLVVAILYLWKNNEDFRKFWIKTWDTIKKSAAAAWNAIKKAWAGAAAFFSGIWTKIRNTFSGIGSWFGNIFRTAWSNVKKAFSSWGSFFSGLWDKIKTTFSKLGTKIGDAVGKSVKSGINGVISAIEKTINNLIGMINGAIKLINKIPKVNIGKMSKLKFPRLAEGGVLKKGQIGFLEGTGAEAVVPLEKNTGWIDKVTGRLQDGLYQPQRASNSDELYKIITLLEKLLTRQIYLDSGVLVGELAAEMNTRLSDIYNHNNRGNTI